MIPKRAIQVVLLLFAILGVSGCATNITYAIRDREGSPWLEVQNPIGLLFGNYIGDIEKNGIIFSRIVINKPRAACNDQSQIEMQLPNTFDLSSHALLKEVKESIQTEGNSVQILLVDNLDVVKSEAWSGYPRTVIFSRLAMQNTTPRVFYRYGPEPLDFRYASIEEDLKWICRSRTLYIARTILLPFAAVFDFLTFPIQLISLRLTNR